MRAFFEKIKQKKILIIGDVMIDSYINGKVSRISPEAPVPVVEYQSRINRLGGAANVALNISVLGAKPILVSVVGNDDNATIFEQLLAAENIDYQWLVKDNERQTTIKTRVMANTQQLLRIDQEDTFDISAAIEAKILAIVAKQIEAGIDTIIFQDYNKGLLTNTLIQKAIQLAQQSNIPTTVDPKKKNFFAYKGVTLFKPNLKEISEALQQKTYPTQQGLDEATTLLQQQMPHQATMITLSEKGIYTNDGKNAVIQPTVPRNIADVCGAGDTVIAVAALGLAAELPLLQIAKIANIAGGQVCESVGVVPITLERLRQECDTSAIL